MATRPKNRIGEDLERLIKAIGDCKSKTEEDRILFRAIESTKASVKTGKVDKQRTRDFLIKLLYFEMLGHDASFGHFLAVQACGSNIIMTKLVVVKRLKDRAVCGLLGWLLGSGSVPRLL